MTRPKQIIAVATCATLLCVVPVMGSRGAGTMAITSTGVDASLFPASSAALMDADRLAADEAAAIARLPVAP
jgi:hypothetical protein